MGNDISNHKSNNFINFQEFKDIINYDLQPFEICKINKHFIRLSKQTSKCSISKNIIFITCDFSCFLYIKEQLETLSHNKLLINFIISHPCHLTFDIFDIEDKMCIQFKYTTRHMCKLIGLLLQNLPKNINILIIDYDVYCLCMKKMNNLPCSLELIQVKKDLFNTDKKHTTNIIKLPHNCVIQFI